MAFLVGGANTLTAGYDIDNSLRFGDGTPRLYRTTVTPTNVKKYTISAWVKSCDMDGNSMTLMTCESGTGYILFNANEAIETYDTHPTYQISQATSAAYRDPSAWMHIVWGVDTTQTGIDNISKIYVNGVRVTSFATNATQANDGATVVNQASITQNIGTLTDGSAYPLNGYVAQYSFIDGQQLTPSSFGEADEDSGIWKPIDVSDLTYGDNGFLLEFKNSAVGTGASDTIGADTSGEDNHFTSTNVATTNQTTDTPTNNFSTLNPLQASLPTNAIYQGLFEGNLGSWTSSNDNTADYRQWSSITIPHNEKWYVETKWTRDERDHTTGRIGILAYHDDVTHGVLLEGDFGKTVDNTSSSYASGSMAYGEIYGCLYDLENNQVTFYEDGTSLGAISWTPNASYTYYHVVFSDPAGPQSLEFLCNFGNPAHSISSGNADPSGYGNFEYSTNSGYALCTKNLAEYG